MSKMLQNNFDKMRKKLEKCKNWLLTYKLQRKKTF